MYIQLSLCRSNAWHHAEWMTNVCGMGICVSRYLFNFHDAFAHVSILIIQLSRLISCGGGTRNTLFERLFIFSVIVVNPNVVSRFHLGYISPCFSRQLFIRHDLSLIDLLGQGVLSTFLSSAGVIFFPTIYDFVSFCCVSGC